MQIQIISAAFMFHLSTVLGHVSELEEHVEQQDLVEQLGGQLTVDSRAVLEDLLELRQLYTHLHPFLLPPTGIELGLEVETNSIYGPFSLFFENLYPGRNCIFGQHSIIFLYFDEQLWVEVKILLQATAGGVTCQAARIHFSVLQSYRRRTPARPSMYTASGMSSVEPVQ